MVFKLTWSEPPVGWSELHDDIGYKHNGAEEWGEHIQITCAKVELKNIHEAMFR